MSVASTVPPTLDHEEAPVDETVKDSKLTAEMWDDATRTLSLPTLKNGTRSWPSLRHMRPQNADNADKRYTSQHRKKRTTPIAMSPPRPLAIAKKLEALCWFWSRVMSPFTLRARCGSAPSLKRSTTRSKARAILVAFPSCLRALRKRNRIKDAFASAGFSNGHAPLHIGQQSRANDGGSAIAIAFSMLSRARKPTPMPCANATASGPGTPFATGSDKTQPKKCIAQAAWSLCCWPQGKRKSSLSNGSKQMVHSSTEAVRFTDFAEPFSTKVPTVTALVAGLFT
mmetsp:Transcript_8967/g.23373  ORF Transcript_8967/g.23373 Transcript_8967/m.23373 type:complete len:284 (-) Transcript_8967:390-1241(-)